eukprot:TRINITY_DN4169_c0_g1_i9.p1 TRINITY_DN4169_c0_g1~~TRINITY_DN4169_c0_g1_i9.p1  ORF type:complete len:171 (-),score=37.07 TRINITY_DN4169_c0_g1_i9:23-535(-)
MNFYEKLKSLLNEKNEQVIQDFVEKHIHFLNRSSPTEENDVTALYICLVNKSELLVTSLEKCNAKIFNPKLMLNAFDFALQISEDHGFYLYQNCFYNEYTQKNINDILEKAVSFKYYKLTSLLLADKNYVFCHTLHILNFDERKFEYLCKEKLENPKTSISSILKVYIYD